MLLVGAMLLILSTPVLAADRALELRVAGQKPSHQAGVTGVQQPKQPAPVIPPKAEPIYDQPSVVRTDLDLL